MNSSIYLGAGALTLIAVLFVVLPLLRHRKDGAVGIVLPILVVAFPVAVVAIYSEITTYPAAEELAEMESPVEQESVAEMVRELAQRMATEPDLEGLVMLGKSYMAMQQYPAAVDAWHQAWELTEGKDPEVSVNYAEALIMSDQRTAQTVAVDLLDYTLQERPDDAKALWYGGMSAAARGMNDLAIERWSRLLNQGKLPDQLRMALQQQLASLGATAPVSTGTTAAASGAVINATIDISPELAEQGSGNKMLFLIARDSERPRPPMAVKRVSVASFPFSLELSDADQMVPGRSLGEVETLEVIARISLSGKPIASSGDLYGQTVPQIDEDGGMTAAILINTVVD